MKQKKSSSKTSAPRKLEVYEKETANHYEYFAGYSASETEPRIMMVYVYKGWDAPVVHSRRVNAIRTINAHIQNHELYPIIRRVTLEEKPCAHCPLTKCPCICSACKLGYPCRFDTGGKVYF